VDSKHLIVLFDGVCNFCNSSVNFIIEHDKRGIFKFAAIQSESGMRLLKEYNLEHAPLSSLVLIDGDGTYTKTSATLRIARDLDSFWKVFYVFILIPPFIRNIAYTLIAKYRYKWFGKLDVCRVPDEKDRERFILD